MGKDKYKKEEIDAYWHRCQLAKEEKRNATAISTKAQVDGKDKRLQWKPQLRTKGNSFLGYQGGFHSSATPESTSVHDTRSEQLKVMAFLRALPAEQLEMVLSEVLAERQDAHLILEKLQATYGMKETQPRCTLAAVFVPGIERVLRSQSRARNVRVQLLSTGDILALRAAGQELRATCGSLSQIVMLWVETEQRVHSLNSALNVANQLGLSEKLVWRNKRWSLDVLQNTNWSRAYWDDEVSDLWLSGDNHSVDQDIGGIFRDTTTLWMSEGHSMALMWSLITAGAKVSHVHDGRTLAHSLASVPLQHTQPHTDMESQPRNVYRCALRLGLLAAAGADFNQVNRDGKSVHSLIADKDEVHMSAMVKYAEEWCSGLQSYKDFNQQIRDFEADDFKVKFLCVHPYCGITYTAGVPEKFCTVCGSFYLEAPGDNPRIRQFRGSRPAAQDW